MVDRRRASQHGPGASPTPESRLSLQFHLVPVAARHSRKRSRISRPSGTVRSIGEGGSGSREPGVRGDPRASCAFGGTRQLPALLVDKVGQHHPLGEQGRLGVEPTLDDVFIVIKPFFRLQSALKAPALLYEGLRYGGLVQPAPATQSTKALSRAVTGASRAATARSSSDARRTRSVMKFSGRYSRPLRPNERHRALLSLSSASPHVARVRTHTR